MNTVFTPGKIGSLTLPNRLVRSATAERMADGNGQPRPQLSALYQELTRGGVGLIITGHMYVHPSGKAHPEMTGIYSDDLIPGLAELADRLNDLDSNADKLILPLDWSDTGVRQPSPAHLDEWRRFAATLADWQVLQLEAST